MICGFRRAGPPPRSGAGRCDHPVTKVIFTAASPQAGRAARCAAPERSAARTRLPSAAPPIRIETPPRWLIVDEPRLIGHVVAGEYRLPAGERRLFQESGDRPALVDAWRLELADHLAMQQHERASALGHGGLCGRGRGIRELGRLAVVQRERQPLVLEQHALVGSSKRRQAAARALERRRVGCGSLDLAVRDCGAPGRAGRPRSSGAARTAGRADRANGRSPGQALLRSPTAIARGCAASAPGPARRRARARSRAECRRHPETARCPRPAAAGGAAAWSACGGRDP